MLLVKSLSIPLRLSAITTRWPERWEALRLGSMMRLKYGSVRASWGESIGEDIETNSLRQHLGTANAAHEGITVTFWPQARLKLSHHPRPRAGVSQRSRVPFWHGSKRVTPPQQ